MRLEFFDTHSLVVVRDARRATSAGHLSLQDGNIHAFMGSSACQTAGRKGTDTDVLTDFVTLVRSTNDHPRCNRRSQHIIGTFYLVNYRPVHGHITGVSVCCMIASHCCANHTEQYVTSSAWCVFPCLR
ncbi:hypothetical protein VTO73DRAFT_8306 [Trametes versicolor]